MNSRCLVSLLILASGAVVGCDPDPSEAVADDATFLRPGGGGGIWLNTSSLGSKEFSELDLTGQLHAGVKLTSVKVKGPDAQWLLADSTEVVEGQLRAHVGQTTYAGAALIDSQWNLSIPDYDYEWDDPVDPTKEDNGMRHVVLWISAYSEDAVNQGRYTFLTLDEEGEPNYVCDSDADGFHAAIPVKNVSVDPQTGDMTARPSTLYLACVSGAVGKAVLWGYKPWERALAEFEVAARMVRADYCFDGVSWTSTGLTLQVRDKFAINNFLREEDPTEVVWTADGLACIGQPRNPAYSAPQVTCNGAPVPTCPGDLTLSSYPDAMFWTKLDGGA